MATLADVRDRTRALLGDPDADWATDGYLDPLVNQVYGKMITYLSASCSTLQEKVIFLPGGVGANQLPIGTMDLSGFQKKMGLLEGLVNPLYVEWKLAGQPPECYCEVYRTLRLPNVSPVGSVGGTTIGSLYYEWRGNKLYMTPCTVLIDLQVRGDFKASTLVRPDDLILDERMLEPIAEGTAAITGMERGNQQYVLGYGSEAMNTLDDIAAALIRQEQQAPARLGSATRRWRWRQ